MAALTAAVVRVKVEYDLFGEDLEHRSVVELQHIREQDFFARFLHYHVVSIVEQAHTHEDYRSARTVYTVVLLTTEPRAKDLRFSVAVSDMDPVSEQGARLGVYRHRRVFLNPKVINAQTPPAARRWMELIADSLDGEVEDARYPDPMMKRVLGAIRDEVLSPEELRPHQGRGRLGEHQARRRPRRGRRARAPHARDARAGDGPPPRRGRARPHRRVRRRSDARALDPARADREVRGGGLRGVSRG